MDSSLMYARSFGGFYTWVVHANFLTLVYCNINNANYEDRSHVEVRAVFIDCALNERKDESLPNEYTRFQREELFKHNILRNCKKKLALTVKMTSEPGKNSGDEYIPVEHVFDGSKKKRVRMLNPFVLRLRREQPLQAYRIRRIDTVDGLLISADESNLPRERIKKGPVIRKSSRMKRTVEHKRKNYRTCPITNKCDNKTMDSPLDLYEDKLITQKDNVSVIARIKRQKKNLLSHSYFTPWSTDDYYRSYVQGGDVHGMFKNDQRSKNSGSEKQRFTHKNKHSATPDYEVFSQNPKSDTDENLQMYTYGMSYNNKRPNQFNEKQPAKKKGPFIIRQESKAEMHYNDLEETATKKYYAVYEIGKANLWYSVKIQLYEKLSTQDGKTVWNDVTKEDIASVSTLNPKWNNEDMSIRYRPADEKPEEFELSKSNLCLVVPLHNTYKTSDDKDSDIVVDKVGEFLIVALSDIIPTDYAIKNVNDTNGSAIPLANMSSVEFPRPVLIRKSRAVMGGSTADLVFATSGHDQFLMIPHSHPHHSQLDVESRADQNQLIHVGASGRIIIAVSDSTRKTRTVLTLDVSNTGLAASRFRVAARDCFVESLGRTNSKEPIKLIAGPVLLPPMHTHRFQIEIPFGMPGEVTHCAATLLNDEEESVAVRDVAIKKNDRCFCVWHCDCVCLSDDPKLLCREMSDSRQIAAGLSVRKVPRRVRSICYPDNITLDIVVVVIGVLAALLSLGCVKAVLGLFLQCIGSWGLERLLLMPRKLDHYYECPLRYSPVVYDDDGWPVHPDTKKRTVRYVSKPVEFVLNLIFFVLIPCVIFCDTLKCILSACTKSETEIKVKPLPSYKRRCKTEDVQVSSRCPESRSQTVRKRSKSPADELSAVIWREGLSVQKATDFNYMRSLLRDDCCRKSDDFLSYADSEQDDTDYVLMQMQKSRESLSRSQRKLTEESATNQWRDDAMPSTSKR